MPLAQRRPGRRGGVTPAPRLAPLPGEGLRRWKRDGGKGDFPVAPGVRSLGRVLREDRRGERPGWPDGCAQGWAGVAVSREPLPGLREGEVRQRGPGSLPTLLSWPFATPAVGWTQPGVTVLGVGVAVRPARARVCVCDKDRPRAAVAAEFGGEEKFTPEELLARGGGVQEAGVLAGKVTLFSVETAGIWCGV